jgi:hypothetical protein
MRAFVVLTVLLQIAYASLSAQVPVITEQPASRTVAGWRGWFGVHDGFRAINPASAFGNRRSP